jgi:hypothetical protein
VDFSVDALRATGDKATEEAELTVDAVDRAGIGTLFTNIPVPVHSLVYVQYRYMCRDLVHTITARQINRT